MAFESNKIPLNDPQVYRQITEIGRFTRDVRHVSGADNIFADFLSRITPQQTGTAYLEDEAALDPAEVATTETVSFQVLTLSALHDLQKNCKEIKLIKSGDQPKNTKFEMTTINDLEIFCEVSSRQARPYVPVDLRPQVISSLHSMDHLGEKATLVRVSSEFYWPSLKKDVETYVKSAIFVVKSKQEEN